MNKIWVLDDDQAIRWVLNKALEKNGYMVRSFELPYAMLDALQAEQPDLLLCDIRMPEISGLDVLKKVKEIKPNLPVIMMTAHTDLDSTVNAFQEGAFDYLAKPFDINQAMALIKRACDQYAPEKIETKNHDVASVTNVERMMSKSDSPSMQEIYRAIGRLAPSNVTVLITGESGTGKELIARAVHIHGSRANKPFIALNMAAIPKDLLEAELFGHERGSFTGATNLRKGRFEEANGGTLFLDEIGDMPLDLQTRLLRVLSEGSFYRIGGTAPVSIDVRIIAATHQPLDNLVTQGRFREDLFHRLNVIRLRIPPLRERREDIPALVNHFMKLAASKQKVSLKRLSPEALNVLMQYDYPGNVRQLENFCQWLTVMSSSNRVHVEDLPQELLTNHVVNAKQNASEGEGGDQQDGAKSFASPADDVKGEPALLQASTPLTWDELLKAEVARLLDQPNNNIMNELSYIFEYTVLDVTLKYCKGRKVDAAHRLGIGRNTVTRKLKELYKH